MKKEQHQHLIGLDVRIQPELKALLKSKADQMNITRSELVRYLLLNGMKSEIVGKVAA